MVGICAFDMETSKFPHAFPWNEGHRIVSLHLATSDKVIKSYVIDHDDMTDFVPRSRLIKEIQQMFDKYKIIVAHNIKFDLHQLRSLGIDVSKHILYCTQVAEYLLNYQDKTIPLSLEETSKRYGITPKIDRVKTYWDAGVDTPSIPLDILIPYGEQDVINCLDIFYKQQPKIRELGMKQLFQVNMETVRVLQEMEWNGMLVDKPLMQQYSGEYGEKIQALSCEFKLLLESKIPELEGIPYNLNSGDHLSVILYGGELKYDGKEQTERVLKDGTIKYGERCAKVGVKTLGLKFKPLPKTQTAKAGFYQTDVQTLVQLKCTNKLQEKALEYIRELSRLEKLRGTYFDGMQKFIANDELIHHNLNQTVTVTGRLSCTQPNLQTIPRGATGPMKQIFISRYVQESGET